MTSRSPSRFSSRLLSRTRGFFAGAWRLVDLTRRTLMNLLLLALIAALVWAFARGGPPALQPKTALVVDLSGRLVEQRSVASVRDTALKEARGQQQDAQTRLRDVLAVLDAAAKDAQITQAVLVLDHLSGAGLASLREVAAAIQRFKASGKPVVAWGHGYDQRQYYLAAHAGEVWMHPMGDVQFEGYGRPRSYYKDLMDKVGVSANVIRAGKFKSAGETFTANGPSPETLEAEGLLFGSLWGTWTGAVETARKQPAGAVMRDIDSLPQSLLAAGGDSARWAVDRKWVDALKTRDEMRAALIARGAAQDDGKTFRQVGMDDYLARIGSNGNGNSGEGAGSDAIGVVVAEGSIRDGSAGPGGIGGESTSALIRRARENKQVKALVLRVNSPGGSALSSELIRRELELTRQAGKPVVVSMGDLAASGGYWISMAADEVIADAGTITGSIGVVAMLPTARGALDKLGVHTGGTGTTWLTQAYDVRQGLDPRFAQMVQAGVDHTYGRFTQLAAAARKTTPEKIDAVAQGRIWAGKEARELGLVDRLGSFDNAVKAAAARAKLPQSTRVQYIEAQPGRWAAWLQRLGLAEMAEMAAAAGIGANAVLPPALQGALLGMGLAPGPLAQAADDLAWLADVAQQRKPAAAAVHCLCTAPQ